MRQKTFLLLTWWILALFAGVYFVIASAVANDIQKLSSHDKTLVSFDHSTVTAVILTSILSVCYVVFTGFILLGRCCAHNTDIGLWYSVVFTSSFWLGIVYIQAGIICKGFVGKAVLWETTHQWSGTDTAVLRVLYLMGYILGCAYIAFSVLLMCCKSAFGEEPPIPVYDDPYIEESRLRV
eukprot:jgi/Ulvmu1/11174/UM072_0010.1